MYVWWFYSAWGSVELIVQIGQTEAVSLYSNEYVVGVYNPNEMNGIYRQGDDI